MIGWHHRLNGHEFGWTPRVGDEQGGLVCCSPWGHKESDMTEWLNWTEYNHSQNAMDNTQTILIYRYILYYLEFEFISIINQYMNLVTWKIIKINWNWPSSSAPSHVQSEPLSQFGCGSLRLRRIFFLPIRETTKKKNERVFLKIYKWGSSLVVQWLRLGASTAGGTGSILIGELHTTQPKNKNKTNYIYVYTHTYVASVVSDSWQPVDCSLPGSTIHGLLQARILKWVAMPSSRGSSPPRDWICVSCISYVGRWILYH